MHGWPTEGCTLETHTHAHTHPHPHPHTNTHTQHTHAHTHTHVPSGRMGLDGAVHSLPPRLRRAIDPGTRCPSCLSQSSPHDSVPGPACGKRASGPVPMCAQQASNTTQPLAQPQKKTGGQGAISRCCSEILPSRTRFPRRSVPSHESWPRRRRNPRRKPEPMNKLSSWK